jgi:hypothetical protein
MRPFGMPDILIVAPLAPYIYIPLLVSYVRMDRDADGMDRAFSIPSQPYVEPVMRIIPWCSELSGFSSIPRYLVNIFRSFWGAMDPGNQNKIVTKQKGSFCPE